MKELTLNEKELARVQVLNNVIEHKVPMAQAAEVLGVTERHAWRLIARRVLPPWPTGTGDGSHQMPSRMSWLRRW